MLHYWLPFYSNTTSQPRLSRSICWTTWYTTILVQRIPRGIRVLAFFCTRNRHRSVGTRYSTLRRGHDRSCRGNTRPLAGLFGGDDSLVSGSTCGFISFLSRHEPWKRAARCRTGNKLVNRRCLRWCLGRSSKWETPPSFLFNVLTSVCSERMTSLIVRLDHSCIHGGAHRILCAFAYFHTFLCSLAGKIFLQSKPFLSVMSTSIQLFTRFLLFNV